MSTRTALVKSPHLSEDISFTARNMYNYLLPTSCHFVIIKSGKIYSSLYKCSHESICLSLPSAPSTIPRLGPVSPCFILLLVFLNHTLLSDTIYTASTSYRSGVPGLLCSYYIEEVRDSQEYGVAPRPGSLPGVPKSDVYCSVGSPSDTPHGRKRESSIPCPWNTISLGRDGQLFREWIPGQLPKVSRPIFCSCPKRYYNDAGR